MSYLLRIQLPDEPGSLGYVAAALGEVEGDIRSVDVVDYGANGVVVDDIVVDLPMGLLPDTLITAAQSISGVEVDSIRPFSGSVDRRGQIALLAKFSQHTRNLDRALGDVVDGLPQTMTAGWAIVLGEQSDGRWVRRASSTAAPEDNGRTLPEAPIDSPRNLDPDEETWLPEDWTVMDSSIAATPMGKGLVLVIGRPGGPDFLPSEVEHLGRIGTIVGAIID
ncbi:amino acid-binding ACT domain protein [Corynebacterium amycolatum]|uniref:amino acid-binding ACT domain protein n=1 Tax=Corynebacterium amycolatum TaxID=43765 RepID=UPI002119DE8C|nr:amino acid-binding ACT domain protein [Corynebacterium amycolatum]MCQ9125737.1 amino acid-binding ACT domain protein [Corynebacterium amycolatum]MCQ9169918.1 amino acid-binding ACT domain protein [Corynebacterium amycolatum]MCQ9176276.1 amino acid-binding ACT domain protein [Corynebacterium amycolatum]